MNGENGASRRWKVGDNVSFHLNAGGGKQFNDEANKKDNEVTFSWRCSAAVFKAIESVMVWCDRLKKEALSL